jgi:RES domain-containing protein
MRVYRLLSKAHQSTAFGGEGARLAGGRWNHRGTPMVYCSESRSLAALELFVNLAPDSMPLELVFIPADVPEQFITAVKPADLPSNWHDYPAPDAVKHIGTEWAEQKSSTALLVPSAVMPDERNILLNPEHTGFSRIKIGKPSRFVFDSRMCSGQITRRS